MPTWIGNIYFIFNNLQNHRSRLNPIICILSKYLDYDERAKDLYFLIRLPLIGVYINDRIFYVKPNSGRVDSAGYFR
jgi:hypothetical protein